jgi:hypothetical protein
MHTSFPAEKLTLYQGLICDSVSKFATASLARIRHFSALLN